jgi:DNA-binding NtrC family response regulator
VTLSTAIDDAAPVDAWVQRLDVPDALAEPIMQRLGELGVQLHARAPGPQRPRNGVVLFNGSAAAAAESIHAVAGGAERVLALSACGEPLGEDSWRLLRAGASDACSWADPPSTARLVAERLRRWHTIDELVGSPRVRESLVGESAIWRSVLRDTVEVAHFTDAPVLITGESGTGKERVAELIHDLDSRPRKKDFVVLDCSTVVPSLAGSEFFGHEKGAFTGASAVREGAFELAHGGTLFLDEVGELPGPLQAELLRVIQEGTFKRVGSNTWRKSRFRLVCATNRDLVAARDAGDFRTDFYYRIAGCTLPLPSLEQRSEDILPLFRHFFAGARPDCDPPQLEEAVHALLLSRAYPGNVRDLRSLTLRIVNRYLGTGVVTVGDVPDAERPSPEPCDWRAGFADGVRRAVELGATPQELAAAAADIAPAAASAAQR